MKQVISFILSFVILFTSMGFTLSSHYCGGKKVKTVLNLGKSDISCGMKNMTKECGNHKQFKKKCCQNEFQEIQIEDDYIPQIADYNLDTKFAALFLFITSNIFNVETEENTFNNHSPPLLVRNIPILIQSFLI